MRRLLTPLVVVLLGIGVGLATRELLRTRPATPSPVPAGDYEIAWIHTTTNPQTWERLVAATFQIKRDFPGVQVDDSRAFLDQTAAVPEVVLAVPGRADKLRIRWYKLSSEVNTRDWVKALAVRNPAPLAFMGGSSSDRAIELAQALNDQPDWKGARPLLFITTATAQADIDPATREGPELIRMYPGRTFRGCFTDTAMAQAVIDFVWQQPDLRPEAKDQPQAYVLAWEDDPYSLDLALQFGHELRRRPLGGRAVATVNDSIRYSVGTFTDPNPEERVVLDRILADLARNPTDRSLLVLPAATQPARRTLRALAADSPLIGWKRLVAVTGDGVSFNTMYRDGDVAWPVQELSIPLVFFAHQDPVRWDPPSATDPTSLHPPTATDDVLLFADMIQVAAKAIYLGERVTEADRFGQKLRTVRPRDGAPVYYGPDGERQTGQGEYVVVVRPQFTEAGRVLKEAVLDVYTRRAGTWEHTRQVRRGE